MDFKYLKSGYQGKPDQMRELAERLTDPRRGHEPEFTFSKSAADREEMRPYKTGGMVSKDDKKIHVSSNYHIEKMKKDISKEEERERKAEREKREKEEQKKKDGFKVDEEYRKGGHVKHCNEKQKFAAGGVAKIRHDQSKADGQPILKKKKSYTNNF